MIWGIPILDVFSVMANKKTTLWLIQKSRHQGNSPLPQVAYLLRTRAEFEGLKQFTAFWQQFVQR
jgi:hypothetical protein